LGKVNAPEAITALEKALSEDAFWAVRAEAAASLGHIKTSSTEKILLAALDSEKNAKVRRAIVTALGEFRTEASAAALAKVLNGDVTDIVEAAAAAALGKTRQSNAFASLETALKRDSFNQVVRSGAFSGLVNLKDEKAIPLAIEWTRYGAPDSVRTAATVALGNLGKLVKDKEKEQVLDRLTELLDDPSWRTRISVYSALQALGETRPISKLQEIAEYSLDGREQRRSREVILALRDASGRDDEVKKLREEVDKLNTENRELRERLDSLEQKLK
jgi:aminopeptidase N